MHEKLTAAMTAPLSEEEKRQWRIASHAQATPKSLFSRLCHHPNIVLGSILLIIICCMGFLGPSLSPYSYSATALQLKNQAPSTKHIFGTDDLGRDIFTRSCYGVRISLAIGLLAACVDLIVGVLWGIIAGYKGGKIDQFMMRIAEMIYSLPYLLFVILVTAVIGPGFIPIIAGMLLFGWIQMARVTRNQVMKIKRAEFVLSAKALGTHPAQVIIRHILPNISGPLIASAMLSIPYAIFTEAFLSFLGLGIPAPYASLGVMIYDGLSVISYYPWRLFIPGFLLCICLFGFYLFGEGLRQIFDPKWTKPL